MNEPTQVEPLEMQCLECDGKGCKACEGKGVVYITSCPKKAVTATALAVLAVVESPHLPVVGGILDQTTWYQSAVEFVNSEKASWSNHVRQKN